MASIWNSEIEAIPTTVQQVNRLEQSINSNRAPASDPNQITLLQHDPAFETLVGPLPTHSLLLSTSATTKNPFFHEACVYIQAHEELYVTSNLLSPKSTSKFPTILISRVKLYRGDVAASSSPTSDIHKVEWVKMRPPPGIDMPNGATNYHNDSIIFCAQGSDVPGTGGIYHMPRGGDGAVRSLVTNWHGRDFNSPNDVVVADDGSIWFTDPCYGHEQDFRHRPQLPNQVYRFDPATGDLRVMADGFGRPNGLCFDPSETILYITDTDRIRGDGTEDLTRAATIYAFDKAYNNKCHTPFLTNRRVFAYAAEGVPDGIKCDVNGNVYAGCGNGVEVWNVGGTLIGTILVPGGVANFCFGKDGEMFMCAEQRLWRVQLARETIGALLKR